jgi:hypothetical protein
VNREDAHAHLSQPALDRATALRHRTEDLALKAAYGGAPWRDVATSADSALESAVAAYGKSSRCLVPFLEEAGAAAAGASDLATAEARYRKALALVPDSAGTAFYRAALSESVASILFRNYNADGPRAKAEADSLERKAQAAAPNDDRYASMWSWIGTGPLDPVFLGPTAGAQALNFMAAQIGVYQQPFGFQLYELHARSVLGDPDAVPQTLDNSIEHNEITALTQFAIAQGDRRLLATLTARQTALVERLEASASPLALDWERTALVGMLHAQGKLDDARAVLAAIAPASRNADRTLALKYYDLTADEAVLGGHSADAEAAIAEAGRYLQPGLDPNTFFATERAAAEIQLHGPKEAQRQLEALPQHTPFGSANLARVWRLRADLAWRQGRATDAADAMRNGFAVTQSDANGPDEGPLSYGASAHTAALATSIDQAVTLALGAPDNTTLANLAADLVLLARGAQLSASAARFRELGSFPLGVEAKLREVRAIRARLARDLRDLGSTIDARTDWPQLDAILKREADVQNSLAYPSPRTPSQPDRAGLAAVVANLGGDTPLVLYVVYTPFDALRDAVTVGNASDPHVAATLVQRGRPARWIDLGRLADIGAAVASLRGALGSDPSLATASQTAAIKAGIDDVAKRLLGIWRATIVAAPRVVIAPDGDINLVPFAALLAPDAGTDGPGLSIIAAASDLAPGGDSARGGPVVMAAPDFNAASVTAVPALADLPPTRPHATGSTYPALPGTKQELTAIKTVLPQAVTLSDAEASKAAFMDVHRPRLLHIASHAELHELNGDEPSMTRLLSVSANPMINASLVFAGANNPKIGVDALASALEIATLDLEGTELVVLSACETGLGGVTAGEDVFGLRRAFRAAGARRVLFSLWKVDDAATAFLMGAFYRGLGTGLDVDAALAHAQGETRRHPGWAQPYYWAGFVLSGPYKGFSL